MSEEIHGTVMTLSALVASSSETLYGVHHGLTFLRGPDEHDSPSHKAMLGNLNAALLSIGRTITGPSMPDVFPWAAALGALDVTAEMISRAAGATLDAGKAIDARGPHDLNSARVALSELVASSAETLCGVQHGHSVRGPGRPVADLIGAADLLDKLSVSLTCIRWTIAMSSMPDVSPPAAMPHLHRAEHLIGQAAAALEKVGKAARTAAQQTRRSRQQPATEVIQVQPSSEITAFQAQLSDRVAALGFPKGQLQAAPGGATPERDRSTAPRLDPESHRAGLAAADLGGFKDVAEAGAEDSSSSAGPAPGHPPARPSETTARRARGTANNSDTAKGAGGPPVRPSLDYPNPVTPDARASSAARPAVTSQASPQPARRTP